MIIGTIGSLLVAILAIAIFALIGEAKDIMENSGNLILFYP